MKPIFHFLLVTGFVATFGGPAFAALATYTVTTSNDAHNTTHPNDVAASQNTTDGLLAPASDLVAAASNGSYGLSPGYPFGYTVSANTTRFPTSLSTAESQGTFLTFTITPATGIAVDLSDIDLTGASFSSDFAGSTTNANSSGDPSSGYILSLTSSLDGYVTDLGDLPFNFATAGNDIALPSQFQDLTSPVTFHLDLYGVNSPDEPNYAYLTLSDGSVINVNGSAALGVPEPGPWALLAAGSCGLLFVRRRGAATIARCTAV